MTRAYARAATPVTSPGAKSGGTGRTIIGGGKAMAAKLEVVVDATMGGEETLRLTG